VLKTIFGKSRGSGIAKEPSTGGPALDLARMKTLVEFFPIGKKLRYYPEFKQEVVFDTLVVGYCVNGHFVYSGDAVERDAEGHPVAFRAAENENTVRIAASALKLFQLLVPDTSHLEMKLDYHRRALIGRGKQFNKGNYISLISNSGVRGVSTVDTEVAKQVILPDGPYANMAMVLLTPELHTLTVTDQRRKSRTKLCVPVVVSLPEGQFTGACTIVDISEGEMRIRMRDREATMPAMRRGDAIFVQIELDDAERRYLIKGSVIRRSPETCVFHLDGQITGGRLVAFSPLDLLELKSGLLNYGE
jgi:hypothetical protein